MPATAHAPTPSTAELLAVAMLPLTERMLIAAEVMTGGRDDLLGETLRLMGDCHRRAALGTRDPLLLRHLDANARECRLLTWTVTLAEQTARALGEGVALGTGALMLADTLKESMADPSFGPEARDEMRQAHGRATTLVRHLAGADARRARG